MNDSVTAHTGALRRPVKVLYLAPYSPAAGNSGGRMRCSFLAETLGACTELQVVVLGDQVAPGDPTRTEPAWPQTEFPVLPETAVTKIVRHLRGLLFLTPIRGEMIIDRKRTDFVLQAVTSFAPDVIIYGDPHIATLHRSLKRFARGVLFVLDEHNVEWKLYRRIALSGGAGVLTRFKFLLFAWNTKRHEKAAATLSDEVWASSETDASELRRMSLNSVHVIPNTIQLAKYPAPPLAGSRSVGFVGWYKYLPNEQAALFLIECSKLLTARGVAHTLHLIGRDPTKKMKKAALGNANVRLVGDVASVIDALSEVDIFAAPLFAGSGTKFKILEALALGKCVITTSVGDEGIGLKQGSAAIVARPDEFPARLAELLGQPLLALQTAASGRNWIENNLSCGTVAKLITDRVASWQRDLWK